MTVSFGIAELTLADGTAVRPPADGMTLFTGPNNSGKTSLLRELVNAISQYPGVQNPCHWVRTIKIHQEGTGKELVAWLSERGHELRFHRPTGRTLLPSRVNHDDPGVDVETAEIHWNSTTFHLISHLLVADQWTNERLGNQVDSHFWDQTRPPNHPAQRLWESKELHARFSHLFEKAFGEPIAINRYVPQIRLQIGSPGMDDTPPPASPELREAYDYLPYLAEQGDGIRAFTNILLHTLVRPAPVIFIDEPEAFLHPPQARLLGRYLASETPSPCQVFVATHSADFLSGALEGSAAPQGTSARALTLVRIARTGGTPVARTLAADTVTEILDTPLLRYSNIASGLFYDGVVLCEAEGDCQFYAATFDTVRNDTPHDNLTFLHVNGKARLTDAAHKLRTCGIPVAVVTDFDFLNDATKVKQALLHLGGQWDEIKDDVIALQAHASSSVIAAPAAEIKKKINGIIGNAAGKVTLSQQQIEEIGRELKTATGWKSLKTSGLTGLMGEPHNSAMRLVEYFSRIGLFLVPVGELECWVRSVPATNKSNWLSRVFSEGHHRHPSAELRDFVARISDYLTIGSAERT
ncbi:ATP-dependent nuclease, partial [Streptomyces sennicomposti]|uniref:ATP-dependent nuclease n=1 Tax=Streptomyces sennicomposti TaxID=2873384 RepID=UPI001CA74266